eukprot:TRINITY_DN9067_c0_g1_i1.p1 TRINITY_DN9067_c0_g1~~TRINITY_DN9067_c0_g1_i1.p1  ORF type:complete len:487 (+),score=103.33 TRINITY_DN9067_c0_g1_i1:250-1710(+)
MERMEEEHLKLLLPVNEFLCPITHEVMADPVIASDGYSYDREAISQWLMRSSVSPMTRLQFTSNNLIPNYCLKSLIQRSGLLTDHGADGESGGDAGTNHTEDDCTLSNAAQSSSALPSMLNPTALFHRTVFGVDGDSALADSIRSSFATHRPSRLKFSWYQPVFSGDIPLSSYYCSLVPFQGDLLLVSGCHGSFFEYARALHMLKLDSKRWVGLPMDGAPLAGFVAGTIHLCGLSLLCFGGHAIRREERTNDLVLTKSNAVHTWDTCTAEFSEVETTNAPSPRINHSGVMIDGLLWIFGGGLEEDGDEPDTSNEVFTFSLRTKEWHKQECSGAIPAARLYHSACAVGHRMFVFGGAPDLKTTRADDPVFSDFYVLDTETLVWTNLTDSMRGDRPSPRGSCTLSHWGQFLFLFGGYDGSQVLNDFYAYHVGSNSWYKVPRTQISGMLPQGRGGHAAAVIDDQLHIFGGFGTSDNDAAQLHTLQIAYS